MPGDAVLTEPDVALTEPDPVAEVTDPGLEGAGTAAVNPVQLFVRNTPRPAASEENPDADKQELHAGPLARRVGH